MRARLLNTSARAVVAPKRARRAPERARRRTLALLATLAALAALAVAPLSGCGGGGSPSAATLLNETFSHREPIESGRIELSFALTAPGTGGSFLGASPLSLHLEGPFQSLGPAQLPRFALLLELRSAALGTATHALELRVTSTAGELFVELAGTAFKAPAATVQALREGYAQATRRSSSAKAQSTFAALGVDPGEWMIDPAIAGTAEVAGAETVHLSSGLDVPRFFADLEKLWSAEGALGTAGSRGASGMPSQAQISALAGSVRSARVDIYTGAHDHRLRRLSLRCTLSTTPGARAALGGLRSGTLTLLLAFADLNRPQQISPPSNPQPVSELIGELERLGLLRGAGTGA
ncbi:MAG: hypothetical protein ABSG95_02445 [Solirubrobacteraceae bacterium]